MAQSLGRGSRLEVRGRLNGSPQVASYFIIMIGREGISIPSWRWLAILKSHLPKSRPWLAYTSTRAIMICAKLRVRERIDEYGCQWDGMGVCKDSRSVLSTRVPTVSFVLATLGMLRRAQEPMAAARRQHQTGSQMTPTRGRCGRVWQSGVPLVRIEIKVP